MPSVDPKDDPQDGAGEPDGPASDVAPAPSGAGHGRLANTLKTGASFKSTWRMPSMRPVDDSGQSGVRRLELDASGKRPPPVSGRTLPSIFGGAPAPGEAPTSDRSYRTGNTLTDMPSAPPRQGASAPRRDPFGAEWVRAVTIGSEDVVSRDDGARPDRHTDPMGSTRLQPGAWVATPAPRAEPARDQAPQTHAGPPAQAPTIDPACQDRPTHLVPTRRRLPWALIALTAAVSVGLVVLALQRTGDDESGDVNLVLPMVEAPAEALPVRTSIKVAGRSVVEGEATAEAADPVGELAAGPMTVIESVPEGAEIVARGAVVANTPAAVPLPEYETEYLVRKPGFVPALIRVEPTSPARIEVQLQPAAE